MRHMFAVMLFVLLAACSGDATNPPPEEVVLTGDTARVSVHGSADIQSHEIVNIRWEEPEGATKKWLAEHGYEHRVTTFDTERMQALGYENFVSEDQTGVRLYGISIWTQEANGE